MGITVGENPSPTSSEQHAELQAAAETSLKTIAKKGDTKIYVETTDGLKPGDSIQIGTEYNRIKSLGSLVLEQPLKSDHSAGVTVKLVPKKAETLHMVNGEYYDLATFDHPGGKMVLDQSRGMDITASVASHHLTDAPYLAMKKYNVAPQNVEGSIRNCGYSFHKDAFFETLKRRVVAEIGAQRIRPTWTYHCKVLGSLFIYLALWAYCCFCPVWWLPIVLAAVFRGMLIGIGHEAIHGRCGGYMWHLFDTILCFPSDKWHYEHALLHHPHCKRYDLDPDETMAVLRMNEKTPWNVPHRVQVLIQIIIAPWLSQAMWIEHHLIRRTMLLQSTVCLFLFQLAPLVTHPAGFRGGCIVYFGVVMASNWVTLHAFHSSHINDECSSNKYDFKDGDDWGEHQLRTTCNWRTAWYSMSGMLDLQIEHHLFPALPYAVQQEIVPIVRKTAQDFDVPYHEFPTLFHGMFAHMGFMQELGRAPTKSKSG